MCAYAGLHAIVIKGFCKVLSSNHSLKVWIVNPYHRQAKEYKPSEEFVDNRWRNAWNAVYVAGGWRLVQPNWAAMQVQTKVGKDKSISDMTKVGKKSDNNKSNSGNHNGKQH